MIDWDKMNSKDHAVAMACASRLHRDWGPVDRLSVAMSICAAHIVQPLNLQKLEDSADGDLIHDMIGVIQNVDHETGELQNCFAPRCGFREED